MSRRLLDYDPFTGITTYFHFDESTKQTILEQVQDVTPALDANKKLQNDASYSKDGIKSGWWHYAYIPPIVIEKWIAEKGVNVFKKEDEAAVYALLNHPDYAYLKTTTGKHALKTSYGKIYNIGPKGSRVHG